MESLDHNLATTSTSPSVGDTPPRKRKAGHIEDGDEYETPTKLSKITKGLRLNDLPSMDLTSVSTHSNNDQFTSGRQLVTEPDAVSDEFAVKDTNTARDELPYCYCNGGDTGDMVSCDGENCNGGWFHWECIGWTKPPKNLKKWFCKDCLPNQAVPVYDDEDEDDVPERTYCFCGDVEYGDMVACDGEDCLREWFHYKCIGWKKAPSNLHDEDFKWFCKDCKAILKVEDPYLPSDDDDGISDYEGPGVEEDEDLNGKRVSKSKSSGKKR